MSEDRDIEKTYSMPEFVAKLRRLADALENGTPFSIQVDGEKIAVPKDAVLSVEHEREGGREELEFQLSWGQDDESDDADDEEDETDEDEAHPGEAAKGTAPV
jgi:amphi-Trp domain-containing protein